MMAWLRSKLGERSTHYGTLLSLALIIGSFFINPERADIADTMRAVAVPLFAGFFFWKDDK
jgi:ABC-type transport system involved in cytochrome c biogenesis permease subunit